MELLWTFNASFMFARMALLIEADMKRTGMKRSFLSWLSQLFPGWLAIGTILKGTPLLRYQSHLTLVKQQCLNPWTTWSLFSIFIFASVVYCKYNVVVWNLSNTFNTIWILHHWPLTIDNDNFIIRIDLVFLIRQKFETSPIWKCVSLYRKPTLISMG